MNLHESLQLSPDQIDVELIPAIREWDKELGGFGVDRLLWFVFGSVVKRTTGIDDPTQSNPFLRIMGVRAEARNFRPESDIDIGLVVADGHDQIELYAYNTDSPFRTASVGGHVLELTRFEHSWIKRHCTDIDTLRNKNPTLGIYGQIVPIEL